MSFLNRPTYLFSCLIIIFEFIPKKNQQAKTYITEPNLVFLKSFVSCLADVDFTRFVLSNWFSLAGSFPVKEEFVSNINTK
jgi:hypothetical protein